MDSEKLRQILSSSQTADRLRAVEQVSRSGNAAHVGPLIAHFKVEQEHGVRAAVVGALSSLIPKERIANLGELASDPAPEVRCKVIEVLFAKGCEQVFPLAVRGMSDSNATVKSLSLQVLSRLGIRRLVKLLGSMLTQEQVPWRLYALSAIGQIKHEEMVPLLEQALSDSLPQIRLQSRASLINLGKLGSKRAQEVIDRLGDAARGPFGDNSLVGEKTIIMEPIIPPRKTGPVAAAPPPPAVSPATDPLNQTVVQAPPKGLSTGPMTPPAAAGPAGAEDANAKRKRMSTGMYKALFGESMPGIPRPKLEKPEEAAPPPAASPAAAAGDAPAGDAPATSGRPKAKWEENVCRDCKMAQKKRPDGDKLPPMRVWCTAFRKEVSMTKTCPRGKWN